MSHKTEGTLKLNNKYNIKKALDRMNLKYIEGKNLVTKGNYSVHEPVDILVTHFNNRDVNQAFGLRENTDGNFTVIGDFYGTGISADTLIKDLMVEVPRIQAEEYMQSNGFSLESSTIDSKTNEIVLNYMRY